MGLKDLTADKVKSVFKQRVEKLHSRGRISQQEMEEIKAAVDDGQPREAQKLLDKADSDE